VADDGLQPDQALGQGRGVDRPSPRVVEPEPQLDSGAAVRRVRERLDELGERPMPWTEAVGLASKVAEALADAEAAGEFRGVLRPEAIVFAPAVSLPADAWAVAEQGGVASLRREWLTPAAVAGQPDDAASNRWLLGLLLYRLLAGHGPFAGLGLRSAIARLGQGAPPLPDAAARGLPPGLQGLVLRILAGDPEQRPADAAAIAAALRPFVRSAEADSSASPPRVEQREAEALRSRRSAAASARTYEAPLARSPDSPTEAPASPRRSLPAARRGPSTLVRAALVLAVVGLGAFGAAAGFAWLDTLSPPTPSAPSRPPVVIGPRPALAADHTSPEDCASCHPRQSAEWKRSVMGHSAKSPLFQGLEILIEEQVGRSDACPGGAGILRSADPRTACRDPNTGIAITGAGGPLWCANCHTPRENLAAVLPAWDGLASASSSRLPLRDLQPASTTEGIDCGFCHQVHGPVRPGDQLRGRYEGNPSWISTATGQRFEMRPEDRLGVGGIANSGYSLDPAEFLVGQGRRADAAVVPGGVHRRPSAEAQAYLRSSQFCGACHDVRLFGADALATPTRGEHFRRLRNAYSEWVSWADLERRAGREPADCQDCHMSSFPGVCVPGEAPAPVPGETDLSALRRGCPPGTRFESRAPGERPQLRVAAGSGQRVELSTHYFSGVDIPLTPEFDAAYIDQPELDAAGIPLGGDQRRDLLLGRSFRFELGQITVGRTLELPILLENTGAGHKIPAGFSQEREFWVHLRVTDGAGQVVYEVGRVDRPDEDLRDKIFVAVNVDDRRLVDALGQPQGVFGADVLDGPDHPQWQALDAPAGVPLDRATSSPGFAPATQFRGRGLINLQNGFLRCVQCIGVIDRAGHCQPLDAEQARHRAGRYADAPFDNDTGECTSNLGPDEALFEVYFPVGSLDASRGVVKGPDAIIDQRSAPPGVPLEWIYELPLPAGVEGPITIEARLLFRAFPPFLIRAFAAYEAKQAAAGQRPSGPLVTPEMLAKLDVVEIARVERRVPL
jgi:eukaryotic-like serine/threonine-protein kinase